MYGSKNKKCSNLLSCLKMEFLTESEFYAGKKTLFKEILDVFFIFVQKFKQFSNFSWIFRTLEHPIVVWNVLCFYTTWYKHDRTFYRTTLPFISRALYYGRGSHFHFFPFFLISSVNKGHVTTRELSKVKWGYEVRISSL